MREKSKDSVRKNSGRNFSKRKGTASFKRKPRRDSPPVPYKPEPILTAKKTPQPIPTANFEDANSMRRNLEDSVRLNKFIATCGIASRRKADELISDGQVRVNGHTITDLGTKVNPRTDSVVVNGKPIKVFQDLVYVMFNKPVQVVSTMSDPEGRPTIADYFTKMRIRIFPVGRLDWDSEGLILLTNDGDFAQKVSHPKNDVAKTYLVKLDGQPTESQLQKLVRGVTIIGGKTHALAVQKVAGRGSDKYDWVKVVITEGRNRQVRQMFEKIGYDVKKLQRVAIGSLKLGNLDRGQYRVLTPDDLKRVFQVPKELIEEKI